MAINLVPVIEFSPELFRKDDREHVPLDHPEYEAAAKVFWKQMLADWGIADLVPYEEGSWFVRTADISERALEILIKQHLADYEDINPAETAAFDGGFVLESDDTNMYPQCCCDLENIEDWINVTNSTKLNAYELWVGHPMLSVNSKDDGLLEISETTDYPTDKVLQRVVLERQSLRQAVAKAETELVKFQHNVLKQLELAQHKHSKALAAKLSGLDGHSA